MGFGQKFYLWSLARVCSPDRWTGLTEVYHPVRIVRPEGFQLAVRDECRWPIGPTSRSMKRIIPRIMNEYAVAVISIDDNEMTIVGILIKPDSDDQRLLSTSFDFRNSKDSLKALS